MNVHLLIARDSYMVYREHFFSCVIRREFCNKNERIHTRVMNLLEPVAEARFWICLHDRARTQMLVDLQSEHREKMNTGSLVSLDVPRECSTYS